MKNLLILFLPLFIYGCFCRKYLIREDPTPYATAHYSDLKNSGVDSIIYLEVYNGCFGDHKTETIYIFWNNNDTARAIKYNVYGHSQVAVMSHFANSGIFDLIHSDLEQRLKTDASVFAGCRFDKLIIDFPGFHKEIVVSETNQYLNDGANQVILIDKIRSMALGMEGRFNSNYKSKLGSRRESRRSGY